jgi:hypothetical protein
MTVRELMTFLISLDPELPVCIDVDDGVKRNYLDVLNVRRVDNVNEPFVALDTDRNRA